MDKETKRPEGWFQCIMTGRYLPPGEGIVKNIQRMDLFGRTPAGKAYDEEILSLHFIDELAYEEWRARHDKHRQEEIARRRRTRETKENYRWRAKEDLHQLKQKEQIKEAIQRRGSATTKEIVKEVYRNCPGRQYSRFTNMQLSQLVDEGVIVKDKGGVYRLQ